MNQNRIGINGFTIKMIALSTMLIDHIGAVLVPQMISLRIIGRISFPLFVFLLVEGFIHTKDVRKYAIRLLIFALISEIPFDLAFFGKVVDFERQNIFFMLFLGILMLALIRRFSFQPFLQVLSVVGCVAAAFLFRVDYNGFGVLLVLAFWYFREKPWKRLLCFGVILGLGYGMGVELYGLLAYLPILFYNGRRGPSAKYVFYIFYPAHLLILLLIAWILHGGI